MMINYDVKINKKESQNKNKEIKIEDYLNQIISENRD